MDIGAPRRRLYDRHRNLECCDLGQGAKRNLFDTTNSHGGIRTLKVRRSLTLDGYAVFGKGRVPMHNISIKDQHDLARLIAGVMEVNSLDTIWTEHSTKGRLGSRQEIADLRAVTDVMNRGIGDVVHDLAPLERFLDSSEKDLNEEVAQFLARSELDPGVKARLTAHFEKTGGFSGYVRQSIAQLRAKGHDAADDVRRQMDQLAAGGTAEGDLWQQIKCALLGAAGGAAAASGNWWALIPIAISADNTGCIPH